MADSDSCDKMLPDDSSAAQSVDMRKPSGIHRKRGADRQSYVDCCSI